MWDLYNEPGNTVTAGFTTELSGNSAIIGAAISSLHPAQPESRFHSAEFRLGSVR